MGLLDRGMASSLVPQGRSSYSPVVLGIIIVVAIVTTVAVLPGFVQNSPDGVPQAPSRDIDDAAFNKGSAFRPQPEAQAQEQGKTSLRRSPVAPADTPATARAPAPAEKAPKPRKESLKPAQDASANTAAAAAGGKEQAEKKAPASSDTPLQSGASADSGAAGECKPEGYKVLVGIHTDKVYNIEVPGRAASKGLSIHVEDEAACWAECQAVEECQATVFNAGNVDPSPSNFNCWLKRYLPIAYDFYVEPSDTFNSLVPCSYEQPDSSICFRRFDNQRSDHGLYTTIYEFDDNRKLPRSGGFDVADEAECWAECEVHPVCRSVRFEKTRPTENCWLKRLEFMVDETDDETDIKYSALAPCDFQIPAECRKNGYQFTRRAKVEGKALAPGKESEHRVSPKKVIFGPTERECWDYCHSTSDCRSANYDADKKECSLMETAAFEGAKRGEDAASVLYPCKELRPHVDVRPVGKCAVTQPGDLGGIEAKGPDWYIHTTGFGAEVEATLNFEVKEDMCGDEVKVHGDVYIKDYITGDCEPCLEAKCYFWTPNTEGYYEDACSATRMITDGTYSFTSNFPGNEMDAHWGPDKHPHWHYTCSGCGGSIYGKFYPPNWQDFDFSDVGPLHRPTAVDAFDETGRFDIMIMKNRYKGF